MVVAVGVHHAPMLPEHIDTERLRLRRWTDADRPPFAALNADPVVMEFFPDVHDEAKSNDLVERTESCFAERDYGLWAVEIRSTETFAGFTGLAPAEFDAHFTPAVEVGWRLARAHWGHGYASEAALAALRDGFERLGLEEIVSFTAVGNTRSRRVMEKLGMHHDPAEDFDHPALPTGHPLERHVLYRITPADLDDD